MLSFSHLSLLSLAISSIFFIVQASRPIPPNYRHKNLAIASHLNLEARDDNTGFLTYFVPGLGACQVTNTPADFIVALNIPQWDSGSHCFETVTLSYDGKTAQAQITDQCVGCAYGDLDLTYALFDYLIGDPIQIGNVSGTWSFGSESGSSTTSSSTLQYTPPLTTQIPTSTYTSSPSASSTSTSTSQSTTFSTSSSSSTTVFSTSPSSASASAAASTGPNILSQFQVALLQLVELSAGAYIAK